MSAISIRFRKWPVRLRFILSSLSFGLAAAAAASNFNVAADPDLRAALNPITGAQSGDTVTFTGNITLGADLPAVQNSITIEGSGFTLNGNNQFRGFFVAAFLAGTATPISVTVTIRDLTIQNALAKGGDSGYGGAGAGLGGSIFVASLANLALSNVILSGNNATGGSAGRDYNIDGSFIAGGGGMGGDGYSGGGGIGAGSIGGYSGVASGLPNPFDAAPGIFVGAASGGAGTFDSGLGYGAGAASGGGGGAGGGGGGGGVGGGAGSSQYTSGGAGGFGGGGGSAGTYHSDAGAGGFGGGGGGSWSGAGTGGFGGGGGGLDGGSFHGFGGGSGGFFVDPQIRTGIDGGGGGGGGGAGLGGGIFVQQGGMLAIGGSLSLNGNGVTAGAGGLTNPGTISVPAHGIIINGFPGSAFGNGIFLQGNDSAHGGSGTLILSPAAGETQTISDTIADQTGSGGSPVAPTPTGGTIDMSGNWGVTLSGAGTVVLSGANTFSGGVAVNSGTLQVNNLTGSGTGSGAVSVAAGATLGGSGSIGGSVTVQAEGCLAPGNGIGALHVGGSVTWNGSSTGSSTAFFALGNSNNSASELVVAGALTKGSGTTFRFDFQGTGHLGGVYTLATFLSTNFTAADFSATNLAPGLTGEFVVNGLTLQYAVSGPVTFSMNPTSLSVATGRSAAFSVTPDVSLPGTTYQWNFNGVPIAGAADPILLISGATSANAGAYTCTVSNSFGSATSTPATLTVASTSSPGYLTNLSSRVPVGTGGNVLITGFAIAGSGSMDLLVRGVGPALTPYGVAGALPNPQLILYDTSPAPGPYPIVTDIGWSKSFTLGTSSVNVSPQAATLALMNNVGAFPLTAGSPDCALEVTPPAGSYTSQVSGVNGTAGVALAEVYDADVYSPSVRLVNVSTRAAVGTGSNILIEGFAIGGSTPETVLVRGVGPTLTGYGVAGALAQPSLAVYSGTTQLYSNTGWGGDSTIAGVFGTVGAFPLNASSADSALLITLPPGSYTAQVSGVSGTTGVALVEVYEVY